MFAVREWIKPIGDVNRSSRDTMEEKLNCESKRIPRLTLPNWCNQYNISICSFLIFDKHLLILVNGGKNVTFHFFLGVIKCVYSFRLLVYFQLVYWGSWWFKRETNRSSLHPPQRFMIWLKTCWFNIQSSEFCWFLESLCSPLNLQLLNLTPICFTSWLSKFDFVLPILFM